MTKKCICQICSCGKHRCPHVMPKTGESRNVISKDPNQCYVSSEYNGNFVSSTKIARGPFLKPLDQMSLQGEFDFNTTTQQHHPVLKAQERPKRRGKSAWKKANVQMELNSEHQTKFVPLNGPPNTQNPMFKEKTHPYGTDATEITLTSTSLADYAAKPIIRAGAVSPPKQNLHVPKAAFEQQSLKSQDYVDFKKPRSAIRRQPSQLSTSKDSFEGTSDYKSSFIPHKHLPKIVKKSEEYTPDTTPFNETSLMKSSYLPREGAVPAERASWNNHLFETEEKLASLTTTNIEYNKKPMPEKLFRKRDKYIPPEGEIAVETTSKDLRNFGSEALPAKSARPKTTIRLGSATFYGKTHSKEAFRQIKSVKSAVEPRNTKMRDPRQATLSIKSGWKNNYISESKGNYKKLDEAPSKYKILDSEIFPKDKMSTISSYGADFVRKEISCPSRDIIAQNFNGLKYDDDFEAGHRFIYEQPPAVEAQ